MSNFTKRVLVRAFKSVYPRLGLRRSDIILGSFPKAGSTWVRFILANIVSLLELGGRRVDHQLLNGPLAAEYDPHRYPSIEYNCLPRFVKTHRTYDGRRFGHNKIVYVLRNPGDTMVSYYEYLKARRGGHRYHGTFQDLLRNPTLGIEAWCRHVDGWCAVSDVILTFESLKEDAVGEIGNSLQKLGVRAPAGEIIVEAVRRSSFKEVRMLEERHGLDSRAREHLEQGFRFTRKGETGQWRDYFEEDDVHYVQQAVTRSRIDGVQFP